MKSIRLLTWIRVGLFSFIPLPFLFPRFYNYFYPPPPGMLINMVSAMGMLGIDHLLVYLTIILMTLAARLKPEGLMRLAYLMPLMLGLLFFTYYTLTQALIAGAKALTLSVGIGYIIIIIFHMITVALLQHGWLKNHVN